jgi:predicted porin
MKKIVMATLFMALTGAASAQLTMSGKVSEIVDTSTTGARRVTGLVTEPTSNFAMTASEKLGNGMTAKAVIETSLGANAIDGNGTKVGDRQSTVGLSNSLISVELGRNVHSQFLAITSNDVFGTLYGSVAGDVHNLRNLRLGNAAFITLTPMKNVGIAYERSRDGGVNASVYALTATVANVDAALARFESGKEKSTVLGLSTKVMGTQLAYTHSDSTGVAKSKGDLVGVARTFGAITAKASYGRTNGNVSAYSVGADYALSKRTEVNVAYRNANRFGTVADVTQVGVGVTHRF